MTPEEAESRKLRISPVVLSEEEDVMARDVGTPSSPPVPEGENDRSVDFFTEKQAAWLQRSFRGKKETAKHQFLAYHFALESVFKHFETKKKRWIFPRDGNFRRTWDVLSIVFTCFLVVYEPYIMAFSPDHPVAVLDAFRRGRATAHKMAVVVRIASSVWFTLDIALNFLTTFDARGQRDVDNLNAIAVNYLKTYFLLDFAQAIPWETLALSTCRRQCMRHRDLSFALGLISMARAVKISKIFRAKQLYDSTPFDLSDVLRLPPYAETLVSFLSSVCLLNHIFACLWYAIGERYRIRSYDDLCFFQGDVGPPGRRRRLDDHSAGRRLDTKRERCTWLQINGYSPSENSRSHLHFTALYWSLATLTTIGYGDIVPNTTREKVYTCFVMLSGVSWFATLVSSVGEDLDDSDHHHQLVTGMQPSKANQKRMKKALKTFMYKHRVSVELSSAITGYLRRHFEVDQPWIDEEEFPHVALLVQQLNKPLQRALALHIFKRKAGTTIPFFNNKPSHFVADCVITMRSYVAGPAEIVVHNGTIVRALHLIITGTCVAAKQKALKRQKRGSRFLNSLPSPRRWRTSSSATKEEVLDQQTAHAIAAAAGSSHDEAHFWRLETGSYFGDEGIMLGAVWCRPLVSIGWTETFIIPEPALALDRYPAISAALDKSAKEKLQQAGNTIFLVVRKLSSRSLNGSVEDDDSSSDDEKDLPATKSQFFATPVASEEKSELQELQRDLAATMDSHHQQLAALQHRLTTILSRE